MAGTLLTKRLVNFDAAAATSDADVFYSDQGSGERATTALQIVSYMLAWFTAYWLNQRLRQWAYANSFQLAQATRDVNEAIVTASIVWPDGATGVFVTDVASTSFPGSIDAWHATYVNGLITKTVTQTTVTRDAAGAVVAQPSISIF